MAGKVYSTGNSKDRYKQQEDNDTRSRFADLSSRGQNPVCLPNIQLYLSTENSQVSFNFNFSLGNPIPATSWDETGRQGSARDLA